MLEVEMKFPAADLPTLAARLEALGARRGETLEEADHYFNAPDRDFARTDEALRIRRIGDHNRITYKGPKRDAVTKTRTEIELPIGDGAETAAIAAGDAVPVQLREAHSFANTGSEPLEFMIVGVARDKDHKELDSVNITPGMNLRR